MEPCLTRTNYSEMEDDNMNTLRKLADKHALLFWILCVLFYIVGYKAVTLGLLGKTPYQYDVAFFKLSLALLAILMMKRLYHGQFCFYFRTKNLLKGLLLLWPGYMFLLSNLLGTHTGGRGVVPETLIMVVVANMITGFYEEVLMRGMLLGHMMEHWRNDKHKILKSVLTTSILFGLVHLGNLATAPVGPTLFQVFYATLFGLIFAAAFLRTKNLWACILLHGLVDVSGDLYTVFYLPGEEITDFMSSNIPVMLLSLLLCIIVVPFEMRKKKRAEILAMWNEETTCPVS